MARLPFLSLLVAIVFALSADAFSLAVNNFSLSAVISKSRSSGQKLKKIIRQTPIKIERISLHRRGRVNPALVQPKPIKEEMKLQQKYAAIESVEDRAFQILLDLGMIEEH